MRRVVGEREDRPLFADSLGELVAIDASQLTVRTSTGPVRIPRALVARAKRVPDRRRPTRREIAELELAADRAWPAPETERLGGWLLRAADGFTGRANSALPIGDPGCPLAAALDAVEHWYA
ncbi:MAG: GNAT family N-acetyltransferase, partial [Micromonosporaceae bacterium]|nr:GNAT family N-acetyltransferase [Micromonosporaceae bacterium]